MGILKAILVGALLGAAAFFMPFFLLKAVLFVMIIGFIFRMFWWRRHWRGYHYMAWTDKIRNMNEDEYASFKEKMNRWNYGCCGQHHYDCEKPESRKEEKNNNV